jgi:CDGSH-type Zn-finger protein
MTTFSQKTPYLAPNRKIIKMASTKITVNSNGSLRIEGDFEIVDPQGNEYGLQGRTTIGLCRCGLSKNKPFCDGSHKEQFEHEPVAFDLPPKKV